MRINSTQLPLLKTLAKAYLISSDEPLLVNEAVRQIKKFAAQEFTDTKKIHVSKNFNWQNFLADTLQADLFSSSLIIELQLESSKIGAEGSQAIVEFLQQQTAQQLLIISCEKLDAATLGSKWITALEQQGYVAQLRAPDQAALPNWISQRLQIHNITVSKSAINLIADSCEGNLLAITQLIERLSLQYGDKNLTDDEVYASLYDSSHYSLFDLVDTWLSGDKTRIYKIFQHLVSEGTEPILLLWALTRECRLLANLQQELNHNNFMAVANKYKIWPKRIPLIKQHLQTKRNYLTYLQQLCQIELAIKGLKKADAYAELECFILGLELAA